MAKTETTEFYNQYLNVSLILMPPPHTDNVGLYLSYMLLENSNSQEISSHFCALGSTNNSALTYSKIKSASILLHDFHKICEWLPYIPAVINPQAPLLFFEIFLINEHSLCCNSPNKMISLVVWCICFHISWNLFLNLVN